MARDRKEGPGSGEGSRAAQDDRNPIIEFIDRYIYSDEAPSNIKNDVSGLFSPITDLSWLGLDISMPGYMPGGIMGFLLTVAILVALGAVIVTMVCHTLVYSWRLLRRPLAADPGEVALGYTKREGTTKRARLARWCMPAPAKRQCYSDTLRHWQVIGPTGGGKTTFLEEKVRQNLREGVTTVILELDGGLGKEGRYYADLYEREVMVLDPSAEDTSVWNPIAGEDAEMVAEQAVNMVASDYITEQYFKDVAVVLTRHAVIAVKSYEERYGAEANIRQVMRFISDRSYRDEVLSIHADKATGVKVTAPWIPEYTRRWFEMVYFGHWDSQTRAAHTTGLANVFERVVGNSALRAAICPAAPGEGAAAGQLTMEEAIESGGLVILRLPTGVLGTEAAVATAGWVMQRLESATRARTGSRPIVFYLDEAHLILGKDNAKVAEGFQHWLPVCRQYHVSARISYQSFSMIEPTLRDTIQGNARSKFICGGLGPDDAEEAERIAGEKDVTIEERRTTRRQLIPGGILSSLGQSVTLGHKDGTEAIYPAHLIRELPPGTWLIRALENNTQVPPCLIKTPRRGSLAKGAERVWVKSSLRMARVAEDFKHRAKIRAIRIAALVLTPLFVRLQRAYDSLQQQER